MTPPQSSTMPTGVAKDVAARTSKGGGGPTWISLLSFAAFFIAGMLLFQNDKLLPAFGQTKVEISNSSKAKNDVVKKIASDADGYRMVGGQWIQVQNLIPANQSSANFTRLKSPVTWAAVLIAYITAIFWLKSTRSSTQLVPSRN